MNKTFKHTFFTLVLGSSFLVACGGDGTDGTGDRQQQQNSSNNTETPINSQTDLSNGTGGLNVQPNLITPTGLSDTDDGLLLNQPSLEGSSNHDDEEVPTGEALKLKVETIKQNKEQLDSSFKLLYASAKKEWEALDKSQRKERMNQVKEDFKKVKNLLEQSLKIELKKGLLNKPSKIKSFFSWNKSSVDPVEQVKKLDEWIDKYLTKGGNFDATFEGIKGLTKLMAFNPEEETEFNNIIKTYKKNLRLGFKGAKATKDLTEKEEILKGMLKIAL